MNDVVKVVAPEVAVNVTALLAHCGVLVMGTYRERVPAATVTELGTEATEELLLDSETGHPPAGAM